MKYLKLFNEGFRTHGVNLISRSELKDFCEMYLAYLIDDTGITITVSQSDRDFLCKDNVNIVISSFMGYENDHAIFKTWGEIKNHFIPFIEMLDKNYNIGEGKSISMPNAVSKNEFTKEEILNDTPDNNFKLHYIKIWLDKEYQL